MLSLWDNVQYCNYHHSNLRHIHHIIWAFSIPCVGSLYQITCKVITTTFRLWLLFEYIFNFSSVEPNHNAHNFFEPNHNAHIFIIANEYLLQCVVLEFHVCLYNDEIFQETTLLKYILIISDLKNIFSIINSRLQHRCM